MVSAGTAARSGSFNLGEECLALTEHQDVSSTSSRPCCFREEESVFPTPRMEPRPLSGPARLSLLLLTLTGERYIPPKRRFLQELHGIT
jgi:hypothetical protein